MTKIAKSTGAVLLLSVFWAVPSEACVYQRVRPGPCPMGTVGGKCVNPIVASSSQCGARQVVSDINIVIPGVPSTGEHGTYDPILRHGIRQPEEVLNSTTGITALGGQTTRYGGF